MGAMEAVETDEEDRPREEIQIQRTSVFTDPFREAEEEVSSHSPLGLPVYCGVPPQLQAEEEREKADRDEQPSTSGHVRLVGAAGRGVYMFLLTEERGGNTQGIPQWSWSLHCKELRWW